MSRSEAPIDPRPSEAAVSAAAGAAGSGIPLTSVLLCPSRVGVCACVRVCPALSLAVVLYTLGGGESRLRSLPSETRITDHETVNREAGQAKERNKEE